MQSIKGGFLLLTLCLCASGVWSRSSADIFESVWEDLGDRGNNIIDGLRDAGQDGATRPSELLSNLLDIKGNFLSDLAELGQNMSNAITTAVAARLAQLRLTISANIARIIARIESQRRRLRRRAIRAGLPLLLRLRSVNNQLLSVYTDINVNLAQKVDSQSNEISDELTSWAEEQLKRVEIATNGVGLQESIGLIGNLIEPFTKNFVNALEEVDFTRTQIEQELNDKLDEYTVHVNDLIEAMNSDIPDDLEFSNRIDELVENLHDAPDELQSLSNRGQELLNDGIFAFDSIHDLLNQLDTDALQVETSLTGIIGLSVTPTAEED